MRKVAIMVVAQNISNKIKKRFEICVAKSQPKVSYDIHFLSTLEKMNVFNKSKLFRL